MKYIPTFEEWINEALKGYEGEADSIERIIDLIHELPDSIPSLTIPTSLKNPTVNTEKFIPKSNKNWKDEAVDVIVNTAKKERNIKSFKLKSYFGKGKKNEPYFIIIK